jgi:hypothetical protein
VDMTKAVSSKHDAFKVRFCVEKSVLGKASGFFESACKKEWTRPKDNNTLLLPEDDPVNSGSRRVLWGRWVSS